MANEQKIDAMLRNLQTYLQYLSEIAKAPLSDFLDDPIKLGGAKYYLQIAIETCLNLGNHLIATENLRAPKDYRDIFTVLGENNILSADLTHHLRQMAGLRNRLVHLYWEVDDTQIYDFLQNELSDFDQFAQQILLFIANSNSK